ncbi:xaa-Pro aminopeptidase 3-like [Pectinophora gossypiella]|uniref:xaa-Pro aminopeptidase 3-like n=1 Tax=Pectinophora gossypiella TaxID=13191 RepID=UPI00214ED11F|nr:xaa-Pro aminopeptidase 3-like [Pectinophora gossypiella]
MYQLRKVLMHTVSRRSRRQVLKLLSGNSRCLSTMEPPPGEVQRLKQPQFAIPKGVMGQPTCYTHPHMVQEGYLTCGITQAEYVDRRDMLVTKLTQEIENENTNHLIVIPAAAKQFMSDKIPYTFRQNSDFFYLTGCLEPCAVLVMVKPAQQSTYNAILFVNDKDSHAELWEGPRTGCSAATKLFAVNESRPVETLPQFLAKTATPKPTVLWYHTETPANPELNPTIRGLLHQNTNIGWADPQRAIHSMRVIKSAAEVELMKETCYIGSQSVNMAMACTKPGITEHTVNAVLEFTSRQAGAEHLSFPPVVAGGPRATHIHYINNNQMLTANDLLLVDTGSQRWLYNSDISRTWPVSGRFSTYHRILYELVLSVQKRLIHLLGEHRQPLDQLFDQMCRLLGTHLQQEGILPKNIDGNELAAKAYRLCPHHVSHYLGLDVHDAPLVRRSIPVQTNMVVTVEPGLYISPNDKSVPEEFRGIGIRVEDDVLITDNTPLVLTESCVKEVDDIEAIVGRHHL